LTPAAADVSFDTIRVLIDTDGFVLEPFVVLDVIRLELAGKWHDLERIAVKQLHEKTATA
jgi:hypothetical protein